MTISVITPTIAKQIAGQAARGDSYALETLLRRMAVGEPYQTYAGSPVGNVTPEAIGDWCFDSTNLAWYRATALTTADWVALGDPDLDLGELRQLNTATIAAAGSSASDATAITEDGTYYATAADGTKGVALPAAAAGTVIRIVNTVRTSPLFVYPVNGGNDNINDEAEDAAVKVKAGSYAVFICISATLWICDPAALVGGSRNPSGTDPTAKAIWFDDFFGDLLSDELLAGVGSGTGNAVALSIGENGRAEIKTASDDGAITANGSSLGLGALNWQANAGGLVMEARLQIDTITAVMLFVGFTDVLPSTIEAPIFLVAGDIDSDAANACGVGFDTDGSTDQWFHGGVKANTDTTPAYSGAAPSATTYYTVRVEVSAAGAVRGFIDGVAIGAAVAAAVTVTTPLCPIIFVANRSASVRNVLVDYMRVEQDRG